MQKPLALPSVVVRQRINLNNSMGELQAAIQYEGPV